MLIKNFKYAVPSMLDAALSILVSSRMSHMGDLVMRISVFVQRGLICQCCGKEIDGEMTGAPRKCSTCSSPDADAPESQHGENLRFRTLAARP